MLGGEMRDTLLRHGPVLVLSIVVGLLAWRQAALEGRLAAVETVRALPTPARVVVQSEPAPVAAVAGPERRGGGGGGGGGRAIDLDDPELRDQLETLVEQTQTARFAERREEQLARFAEEVEDEVARFGEEHGLSSETTDAVLELLEDMNTTRSTLFAEVREGRLTFFEMRSEMRAAHEETEAGLEDLLGAEDFAALSERIPFGPGPGPR